MRIADIRMRPLNQLLCVNKMKILITIIFLSITLFANAGENSDIWKPIVKFKLEESSYKETLIWVSGNSYAYSSFSKEIAASKIFCTDGVGSKVLLEILNKKYAGVKITSEQASKEIKRGLQKRFPCK